MVSAKSVPSSATGFTDEESRAGGGIHSRDVHDMVPAVIVIAAVSVAWGRPAFSLPSADVLRSRW